MRRTKSLLRGTRRWTALLSIAVAWIASPVFVFADDAKSDPKEAERSPSELVNRFMGKYCLECHDATSAEGDREFESFGIPFDSASQLITADEIVDQVTLNLMPPEDEPQPSDDERLEIIETLRTSIRDAKGKFESTGGHTVMRRLSNREYENTLATLFDRRVDTLGLTADFPRENTSHHMDNIGESLVTSGFLLDQYFYAAARLVEMRLNKPKMKPKSWHFKENFRQYEELSGAHSSVFKYKFLCLYEQPNTDTRQGGYGHIEDFLQGVPVSGLYDLEVNAQAMHRDTHYDPKIFGIDFSEPFQLAVVPGDVTKGHIHYPQAIEPILASAIVPDEKPEWLKFQVWLEAGQTPRFIFPNGPYESRASVIEVNKKYNKEFKNPKAANGVGRKHILREGALPHIKIGEIKIRGPLPEPSASKEELAVFGEHGFQAEHALVQLNEFAQRAYRRPLNDLDRRRIESLYQKRVNESASPRHASLDVLKMILCSPSFLYLSEVTPEDDEELQAFDLATRLSYAIWASPPDKTLFDAASSGGLRKPAELKAHVVRMLKDESSDEFTHGFVDSWMNLREIGNLPPPRQKAKSYYAEDLPASMKQEAYLFFKDLLDTNGSVLNFLESDYTFVDKKLAKLYQLPEAETLRLADGFQKVSVAENKRRGGVLGMAGVLTVSANGVDTSPVTRGVWVSENILGITPPPPPDEVPSIDANVSGAKSIREKLALHSADKACYVCHRNIDPLGYPLETFDPIGRWRVNYPKSKGKNAAVKIDAAGKLPSGEEYVDFVSFKNVLVSSRRDLFVRNLITKLLTYATGRHMEPTDRYEIDEILARAESEDFGLRTIVTEALTSRIFRTR